MERYKAALVVVVARVIAAVLGIALLQNKLPEEKFSIDSVFPDFKEKSVKSFKVNNAGSLPIKITEVYLVTSDGAVMNHTDLSFPEQLPSTHLSYDVSLSYSMARATELYLIMAVSANGANATSTIIPLTCNCNH